MYEAHGQALHQWTRRRFADQQVAEEVVQETVLSAWRKYPQFDPDRGSERAWVFGIAKNVAATRHARGRRHLVSMPTAHTGDIAVDDEDIARIAERSVIADALSSLSADHQAVICAAFWDGLSTKEMAVRLQIPDGTVKSRLYYALRSLRTELEERDLLT